MKENSLEMRTLLGETSSYLHEDPILCKSYGRPHGRCNPYKTLKAKNSNRSIDLYLESLRNKVLKKVGLEGWPFTKGSFGKSTFNWYEAVEKMIESGIVSTDQNGKINLPIINIEIGINDYTKDEYVLKIDSPDIRKDMKYVTYTELNQYFKTIGKISYLCNIYYFVK